MSIPADHPDAPENTTTHWQQPFWFAVAGLLIGLLLQNLGWLYTDAAGQSTHWIGLETPLHVVLVLFLPAALLLWRAGRGMLAPLYLVVMLALAAWAGWQTLVEWQEGVGFTSNAYPNIMIVVFTLVLTAVLLIAVTFGQAWQREHPHFPYPKLFAHAWDNVHTVALAVLFAQVFFLVLLLGASLFESVGLKTATFHPVEWLAEHWLTVDLMALGAGIGVIQQFSGLLLRLHTLVFALYQVLAYLTAVIVVGFTLAVVPTFQTFFANQEGAIILLGLVAISILLLNTLVERGSQALPRWANGLFSAQIVVLPILTALAGYALLLRVREYGLAPTRLVGLLLAALLLVYTVTYAVQWVRYRAAWSQGLKASNALLALLTAFMGLLLLSPVLDPTSWSARDQLARLQAGKVSAQKFDYHTVRHGFGRAGKAAMETMQGWKDRPDYALIAQGIKDAAAAYPSTVTDDVVAKIEVIPAEKVLDKAFFNRLQQMPTLAPQSYACLVTPVPEGTECVLLFKDVNGDAKDEALLVTAAKVDGHYNVDASLFLLDDTGLPRRGKSLANGVPQFTVLGADSFSTEVSYVQMDAATYAAFMAALRAGQLTAVMPRLPELQIGGQHLQEQ
jgi:hypothetical protein